MSEEEIKFRAYLLILNSEFPTHRKTEAMEELLKIYNKQQKEIEEAHNKLDELENADLTLVYMNGFYDGENKWKNKIREKIKELEDILDLAEEDKKFAKYKKQAIKEEINDLEELLGE